MYLGKSIAGTGVDVLLETGVFVVKVIESICSKLFTISERDSNAFWKVHNTNDFKNSINAIKKFVESLDKKNW